MRKNYLRENYTYYVENQSKKIDPLIIFCLEKRLRKLHFKVIKNNDSYTNETYKTYKKNFLNKLMFNHIKNESNDFPYLKKTMTLNIYQYGSKYEIALHESEIYIRDIERSKCNETCQLCKKEDCWVVAEFNMSRCIASYENLFKKPKELIQISPNNVVKIFKHYNALRFLKRSVCIQNALERW